MTSSFGLSQPDRDICKKVWYLYLGVRQQPARLELTAVPAKETTYICKIFEFEDNANDYHLIATEPIINNSYILHHIVIFGCEDGGHSNNRQRERKWESERQAGLNGSDVGCDVCGVAMKDQWQEWFRQITRQMAAGFDMKDTALFRKLTEREQGLSGELKHSAILTFVFISHPPDYLLPYGDISVELNYFKKYCFYGQPLIFKTTFFTKQAKSSTTKLYIVFLKISEKTSYG